VVPPNPDLPKTLREVVIDGNAETRGVTDAALYLEGYYEVQIGDARLPREGAVPIWRHVSEGGARTWPEELSVELPADGLTLLVAWLDLNGNERLDTGDRVGKPVDPLPLGASAGSADPVAFRIDRIYVSLSSPGPAGATQPAFGGTSYSFEIVAATEDVKAVTESGFILIGFAPDALNDRGFPKRGQQPIFQWKQAPRARTWPLTVQAEVPGGLPMWLFAVVDVDADGALSPGDHVAIPSAAFEPPAAGTAVVMTVDQTLPSKNPGGPDGNGDGGPDGPGPGGPGGGPGGPSDQPGGCGG
jgi:hypothetical protein